MIGTDVSGTGRYFREHGFLMTGFAKVEGIETFIIKGKF